MSGISISPYFPFRRIKITKQAVDPAATKAVIDVTPDQRFQPVCHLCGKKAPSVHSWTQRSVRDLNLADTQVWLRCEYRKLLCARCQRISVEDLERFHPYLRVTRRLAALIHQLCKAMTVADAARHFLQQDIIEFECQNTERRKGDAPQKARSALRKPDVSPASPRQWRI